MQNYICEGSVIEVTAGAAITSGDPVLSGSIFGVATNSAAIGEVVAVRVVGVYSLAKATGAAWSLGDRLFWDATNKVLTKTASANTPAGFAYADALSADATGLLMLTSNEGFNQAANVAAIATADGSDAGTTQTLANATKTTVNAILTALENAGIMAAS